MTIPQMQAIRCAHADLVGALQAHQQMDYQVHDWDAHLDTIVEIELAFPDLIKDKYVPEDEKGETCGNCRYFQTKECPVFEQDPTRGEDEPICEDYERNE